MHNKVRKLNHQERLSLFKQNPQWKAEVTRFEHEGYTYEEAVVKAMDHNSVPVHGRTVVRDTTVVKVL